MGALPATISGAGVGIVCDLSTWNDLLDFEKIELGGGVLVTAYHQNILEALMVRTPVEGRAITHTIEVIVFQLLDHLWRVEGAGALTGIGIQQSLHIAGLGRHRGWEAIFLAEGLDEGLGTFVLQ